MVLITSNTWELKIEIHLSVAKISKNKPIDPTADIDKGGPKISKQSEKIVYRVFSLPPPPHSQQC
jgi:hypothetical protein